ncbi:MAG TPA: hypothetical protein VK179_10880 [Bacteroidales bacterium]|nr:hypothetical protein [Bacteroidales bacterium]
MIDLNNIIQEYRNFLLRAFRIVNSYDPLIEEEPIKRYLYADSPLEKDYWYTKIKKKVAVGLNRLLNREVSLLRKTRLQLNGRLQKATSFNTIMFIIIQINHVFSWWDKSYEINLTGE